MAYVDTNLKVSEFPAGENRSVKIGDVPVALFRVQDDFFALNGLCPHRGAPLHEGFVSQGQVTCPWHQWQFELKDGVCRNIPGARVPAYPVEIRNGTIWIDLEKKGSSTK